MTRHLSEAGPRQFIEYQYFVTRPRDAVDACRLAVDGAALVVLGEVVGGLVTDGELAASFRVVPDWLREG